MQEKPEIDTDTRIGNLVGRVLFLAIAILVLSAILGIWIKLVFGWVLTG